MRGSHGGEGDDVVLGCKVVQTREKYQLLEKRILSIFKA
jgi:hypothetical protein